MPHRGSIGGSGGSPVLVSSPVSVPGPVSAVLLVTPGLVLVLAALPVPPPVESVAVVAGPSSLVSGGSESDERLVLDSDASGGWSVHPAEPIRLVSNRGSTGP